MLPDSSCLSEFPSLLSIPVWETLVEEDEYYGTISTFSSRLARLKQLTGNLLIPTLEGI